MTQLPEVLGAMISDGLELLDYLGASTGGALASAGLKAYLQRGIDKGRNLLLDELTRGDKLPAQAAANDDTVAVIYHYFRSACLGTARVNLRLLAQGIAGRLRTDTLIADEFLPHAEALASLSRDEVILLATMYAVQSRFGDTPPLNEMWQPTVQKLEASGWSKDHVQAVAARALRSGYVLAVSAWDALAFRPSPQFLELCKTIDFADALRREDHATPLE
jgi:hypothetical protein